MYFSFSEVDALKPRVNWMEVSDLKTQIVLIDVVRVRADTWRVAWHHLVSVGTPWQQRAPPWCHLMAPLRDCRVPLICTRCHDLEVRRLDLILDIPLSHRTPIVVCLFEQPVKKGYWLLTSTCIWGQNHGSVVFHFHFVVSLYSG